MAFSDSRFGHELDRCVPNLEVPKLFFSVKSVVNLVMLPAAVLAVFLDLLNDLSQIHDATGRHKVPKTIDERVCWSL